MNTPPVTEELLKSIISDIGLLQPELVVAGTFICLILAQTFRASFQVSAYFTLAGLLVAACTTFLSPLPQDSLLGGMITFAPYAFGYRLAALLAGILTVLLALRSPLYKSGFFVVMTGALVAVMLLCHSSHLLMLYLCIEMLSICSYALAAWSFKAEGAEGSIKYLIFGAFSSALMLYGFSLLYGLSGTMTLDGLAQVQFGDSHALLPVLAVILSITGLLFKLAAVPFHFWVPDAYHGARLPVLGFFSTAPKVATVAILFAIWPVFLNWLPHFADKLLPGVVILTLIIGNAAALRQSHIKRLLAYATIAQAGLLAAAVLAANFAQQATLFYLVVYMFGLFAVLTLLTSQERAGKPLLLTAFSGVGQASPWSGVLALAALLSLTGLPPLAGFSGKLFIFSGLWQAYIETANISTLVVLIVAALVTVISLFYYIRLPFMMFFKKTEIANTTAIPAKADLVLATALVAALLLFFIKTNWLMNLLVP